MLSLPGQHSSLIMAFALILSKRIWRRVPLLLTGATGFATALPKRNLFDTRGIFCHNGCKYPYSQTVSQGLSVLTE